MAEENALIAYLDSEEFLKATATSTRLVNKLKTAVQNGKLYETHQIIRTINFRFINIKEKVPVLENLLYLGSYYLLKTYEHVSGQDIGTLFLEAAAKRLKFALDDDYELNKINVSEPSQQKHTDKRTIGWDICQKVSRIVLELPDTDIGQSKFVADALKILGTNLLNRDLLHEVLALGFWSKKNYTSSRYHFLHCVNIDNAQNIAKLLVEFQSSCGPKSEVDIFITQFILQFLCLQNLTDPPRGKKAGSSATTTHVTRKSRTCIKNIVEKIFTSYTLNHPNLSQVSIPFSSSPLLNFTYFIISMLDSEDEASAFRLLCETYRPSWSRDPNFKGYLTRIGSIYFDVVDESAKNRQGGFFNNILMSLLDGDDSDEESNPTTNNNLLSNDEPD